MKSHHCLVLAAAVVLGACRGANAEVEDAIVGAVREAAGGAPELQFSDVSWCPETVDGKRAAIVSAVGPVVAGTETGAGGYFVEVAEDGSVGKAVKATPPAPEPPSSALRIDRTYCEGRLVEGPYEAMKQLREMSMGTY